MLLVKCDQCGVMEPARIYHECGHKQQFCEPVKWLRRFDSKGMVIATLCSHTCDKAYNRGGTASRDQLK